MRKYLYNYNEHIKYPGLVATIRALKGLIRDAEEAGDTALAELRRERYHDLTYRDIELENLVQFPNGRIVTCVIARLRGWLRYDLEIGLADMFDIIEEYKVPIKELDNFDQLKSIIADQSQIENCLVYQRWNKRFGIIVKDENETSDIPRLLGEVAFGSISRDVAAYDPVTLMCGTALVEDIAIGSELMAVYLRSEYIPDPPDPDDIEIVRIPMSKGVTRLSFKLNKVYPNPVWNATAVAPELVASEIVVSPDGRSATMDFSLIKNRKYYPGVRKLEVTVEVSGDEWVKDKSFQHNPVDFGSMSGSNDINDVLTSTLGVWSGDTAKGMVATGPVTVKYTSDDDDPLKAFQYDEEITSQYTTSSTLYIKTKCPVFQDPGQVRYYVMVDGPAPDSSNWAETATGVQIHPPEGATKIIVEPITLVKGDTEYDYIGTVNAYWNDEAKTPVRNPSYGDLKVTRTPSEQEARQSIKASATGYDLHFSILNETIDEMTVKAKLSSYAYIGYPYAWFEHRYNYTGGDQVVAEWSRMIYSYQTGIFKYIRADGVTVNDLFTKVGFQEGIWSTMTNPKLVTDGIGNTITLDMHVTQYNRPGKELTIISLSDGDKQYDIKKEFDYKPVQFESITTSYDEVDKLMKFTVTMPEGGLDANNLIVERDYDYGGGGTVTSGWIRSWEVVDSRTVTFSTFVNNSAGATETFYRIWFSNKLEETSSYRWTDTIKHQP